MRDMQIVELDADEPIEPSAAWRAGSLAYVAVPMVVIAAVIGVVSFRGTEPVVGTTTWITSTTAGSVESGDPEVLADQHWLGVSPNYPFRGDVAEAVLYGTIYVIGGSGPEGDGRSVYRYDPHTGTRERAADLPISLDHAMAATLDGRVYVFGGFEFAQPSARVFSLGANDARWTEHTPMPRARAAGGAATLSGHIYIVGGVGNRGAIPEIWTYDTFGHWSTWMTPLPTPRDHLAVGTYQGRVCAAGGNGGERAFECYDPDTNRWKKLPDLRKPVVSGRAVEAAGWFWVVGADVQVFTIDHWHFGPRPQAARSGHALVAIDGALYVIAGESGLATMEMLRPQP